MEDFKVKAEKDLPRLRKEADNLRTDLKKIAQDLTTASEKVVALENTIEYLWKQLAETNEIAFADSFRSYVTGLLD